MSKKRQAETAASMSLNAALDSVCGEGTAAKLTAIAAASMSPNAALDSVCGEGTAAKLTAIAAADPKQPLAPGLAPNQLPLPQLAEKINNTFAEANALDQKAATTQHEAHDKRLAAGRLLLDARARVAPGQWEHWLRKNIKRSLSDCRAIMAIVEAPEPEKAREAEKAKTRARVQSFRQRKAAVAIDPTAVTPAPVTALQSATARPDPKVWAQALPQSGINVETVPDTPIPGCPLTRRYAYCAVTNLAVMAADAAKLADQAARAGDADMMRKAYDAAKQALAMFTNYGTKEC